MIELTVLSANEYERVSLGGMTPALASEFLRGDQIVLRTFSEILHSVYPYPDLTDRLIQAFSTPHSNPGSVSKKVLNWLSEKNRPTNREDVFRIAFALHLSEDQCHYLLGHCTEYGIHYRNGRDLVYTWFLRRGLSYAEAHAFYEAVPPMPRYEQYPPDTLSDDISHELKGQFLYAKNQEELYRCYLLHLQEMGRLHVRAYHYFEHYLNQLIHPTSYWDATPEPDYSLEAVMERYLSLQIPSGKDRSNYSTTQKLIKRNWPNATALKKIRSHKEDVPRKLLLLLYVITENSIGDEYQELDEDYLTMPERLEDHWYAMNAILTECGMPSLDPRNASDWLILYSVAATEEESMSERMQKVIEKVFSDLPDTKE